MTGGLKAMKGEKSQGKKLRALDGAKEELIAQLGALRLPEVIIPKFSISPGDVSPRSVVHIAEGSVGYLDHPPLLSGIHLSLGGGQRLALTGDNGSGKSTLIKAILGHENMYTTGEWYGPKGEGMGYVDQHYSTLDPCKSVVDTLADFVPAWCHAEVRRHLNDFLFRKNEEVEAMVATLSGGEKARLSLACIAARTPHLLILDEITNNLDVETKNHVLQVLQTYPGAMILISHERDFLEALRVDVTLDVAHFKQRKI